MQSTRRRANLGRQQSRTMAVAAATSGERSGRPANQGRGSPEIGGGATAMATEAGPGLGSRPNGAFGLLLGS